MTAVIINAGRHYTRVTAYADRHGLSPGAARRCAAAIGRAFGRDVDYLPSQAVL